MTLYHKPGSTGSANEKHPSQAQRQHRWRRIIRQPNLTATMTFLTTDLKDALLRTLAVAQNVGILWVLVQAIPEKAKQFYLAGHFSRCRQQNLV